MKTRTRGIILALTILMSAAMFFFALMYLNLYRAERQLQGQGESGLIAWEAASAGIQAAAVQLKASKTWTTGFNAVSLPASGATYTMTFTSSGGQPYSTNNASNTSAVTGWQGRIVPAGTIHLVSVGRHGTTTSIDQALAVPAQAPFGMGVFGSNSMTLGTYTVVDGYDGTTGQLVATGGNIGTNTTANGKITLSANVVVNGIVRVGVGGTSAVIKGSGTYQSLLVPTVAWPDSPAAAPFKTGSRNPSISGTTTLAPGAYKDVNVGNNETLILTQGTYVVRNLSLGDNATLIVQGPVEWWFNGSQVFGRNTKINVGGQSKDFKMYSNGTPQNSVTFNDGATIYGCMYGPFANLTLNGSAQMYGSFVAKNVNTQSGTSASHVSIHNDSSLVSESVSFNLLTQW